MAGEGTGYADAQKMFGPLNANPPLYNGSFVRFVFDEYTAEVVDYTVLIPGGAGSGTLFFKNISLPAVTAGTTSVDGSTFTHVASSVAVTICNNPGAAMIVRSLAVTSHIDYLISSGIDVSRAGSYLNLSVPSATARLFVTGSASIWLNGSEADVELPPGTSAVFRADSVAGEGIAGPAGQVLLADEAVKSHLLLESYEVGLEGFVASSDIAYGGVTHASSTITSDGFRVTMDASFTSPKLVALYVHGSVLAINNDTPFDAAFDGFDMTRLAGIDDVAAYTGFSPAYTYVKGVNGLLFLIYLPQSGLHDISVAYLLPPPGDQGLNPIQAAGIAAIVLVIVCAAAAFMWRRRKPRR